MMNTRSLLCSLSLALLFNPVFAQSNHLIGTYGNVYKNYDFPEISDTPAPEGYKPFYISHISRHGSRYPVSSNYVRNGLDIMLKGDSMGILTPDGRRLLRAYRALDSVSIGMYGMLCELGIDEHKRLGERMAKRFSVVFADAKRKKVNSASTDAPRAIVSGTNFCAALAANTPKMDISFIAGPKYADLLHNENQPWLRKNNHQGGLYSDAYMEKHFPYDSFYGRLFTDTQKIYAILETKRLLAESTFANGTVADYLGLPEMLGLMKPEEYKEAAIAYTNKMFYSHCNSKKAGHLRIHLMDELLKDFISKADAAINDDSDVAADLRFSHDTALMPFFSLIGLKGFEKKVDFDDAYKVWDATRLMCMAANLQMVFYKDSRNDVLVKFLHNEQETDLPLLRPFSAPYYKWQDVREYFLNRLKQ